MEFKGGMESKGGRLRLLSQRQVMENDKAHLSVNTCPCVWLECHFILLLNG